MNNPMSSPLDPTTNEHHKGNQTTDDSVEED